MFTPEDGPDSLSEVGASGGIWLGAHGLAFRYVFPARRACCASGLAVKMLVPDGLCENTRIQAASKLQARRDLLGINGRSQTVINIRNLSPIRDSTARTTTKQDGSDDLGEKASVRQVARSEVRHDECRHQQGL